MNQTEQTIDKGGHMAALPAMADSEVKYDVAISFLHRDEAIALEVESKLREQLNIFVYSKKQEELAGTNGIESFRAAFRTESRVVVVLYRKGWGDTPWTRVEQAAITDRFLEDGWDFLLFVDLNDSDSPPKWLPKSEIRLSLAQYGIEQLLGAIKVRAQKLGSVPHKETAAERAKRLNADGVARKDRQDRLDREGNESAHREYASIGEAAMAKIGEVNEHLGDQPLQAGTSGGILTMRARNVSMNTYLYVTYPITDSRIVVQHFKGRLMLPSENGWYRREPKVIEERRYTFDYQAAYGWCWHPGGNRTESLSTAEVADGLVMELLTLQDKFERGEIRWSDSEM